MGVVCLNRAALRANILSGFEIHLHPGKPEIMQAVLQSCWANDIITVVAAGNGGADGDKLHEATPQNFGTTGNGLITVGSVHVDGVLDTQTTLDANQGGSITVYAVSQPVVVASKDDNRATLTESGTSLAAPAVAGLAAYFASLTSLDEQWKQGSVATDMKNYIKTSAYVRSHNPVPANIPAAYNPRPLADSIVVAYNRARSGLCCGTCSG